MLWIDYFRELDTTLFLYLLAVHLLWIDYFRELDTTCSRHLYMLARCGLITLGN